jgi:UDP-N-acetylglucosamine 2-epimerase (non-hydrolysing)
MTIVGTRPEIIKLSRVIPALDAAVDHVLVHTQQNYDYELNQLFFEDLKLRRPDHALDVAGGSLAETIAKIIAGTDAVFASERPDALLVLGDTNSCLSVIPAKRRKIPIFHMEAGNRSFDQRVPEETNRRIVDHVSDINLPYSEHARRYLIREGIAPETVIKTGSPMKEVLTHYRTPIAESTAVQQLGLKPDGYFVVSAHREENVDDATNLADFIATLRALYREFRRPAIVSTHPRTRKRLEESGAELPSDGVTFLKPLSFTDYVRLEQSAFCVVSDSGTITEESSLLDFPAVTIRQSHERPEGMDVGTLVMCGLKAERVVEAVRSVTSTHAIGAKRAVVPDYDVDDVSRKVVRIILSYTDYVKRTVWLS